MRVNLDLATIGGKLSSCSKKPGIVGLTCVGVGVKLTAASKAPNLKICGVNLESVDTWWNALRYLQNIITMVFPSSAEHLRNQHYQ